MTLAAPGGSDRARWQAVNTADGAAISEATVAVYARGFAPTTRLRCPMQSCVTHGATGHFRLSLRA